MQFYYIRSDAPDREDTGTLILTAIERMIDAFMFNLAHILFFVTLLSTNPAVAHPSPQEVSASSAGKTSRRTELLKEERLKKGIAPYKLGTLEKGLLGLEKKGFGEPLGTRFGDFYFSQGGITTGAGLTATGRYFKANLFHTPIDVSASVGYSLKQYKLYTFQIGNVLRKSPELFLRTTSSGGLSLFEKTREREGNFYLYGEFSYRDFTQEDFYGLGNDSDEDDRTDFRLVGPAYEGVGAFRFGDRGGAFFRAGIFQPEIKVGKDSAFRNTQELFDDETAPGLEEQPAFFRVGAQVFYDYRDLPGDPETGGLYAISLAKFMDRDGDDFDFYRIAFDARQFIPLWSEQRILALHFYTSLDEESGDSRVPFYLMQTLGGSDTVRGYSDFRFRDKNLFLISTEYRWEPTPAVELALFYDAGKVFHDRSDFDFSDLKKGYGFGIRFKSSKSVFLRLDLGRSEEGTSIYLKWSGAF